jgi:hypothetical protein
MGKAHASEDERLLLIKLKRGRRRCSTGSRTSAAHNLEKACLIPDSLILRERLRSPIIPSHRPG